MPRSLSNSLVRGAQKSELVGEQSFLQTVPGVFFLRFWYIVIPLTIVRTVEERRGS